MRFISLPTALPFIAIRNLIPTMRNIIMIIFMINCWIVVSPG